ncbi:hypothetical protein CAPTEDRAFT_166705 [Capitella teleta]|uniref:diphthine methyl ester synthase n=1 Tax=Capitella teleta TaxID=283909 RepID=R7VLH8_CAPTE|nr:hypothetical protein CAPTEDRAFT_166705 [Capitella teleta]|eukprot:ELU18276.1 hypothetical protein CAPTEDRAFT_166705 [Capitella teleta]
MLYFIGLGLGDAEDITLKGLKIVKNASRVYLEAYTSILGVGKDALEELYGREVILADRDLVEQESEEIMEGALSEDIAFLVVGDPFGATTHTDLLLRAKERGIDVKVIHNASIMNAIGCCGLQLYNFGETVSIVFWTDSWQPESFYDKIAKNRQNDMHTLCLLDIKVKEQSIENLMKGRKIYEPPRYMTVNQAAEQLMQVVQRKREQKLPLDMDESTVCVGVARVGSDDQAIKAGTLEEMTAVDLGGPLHSMVIAAKTLHPLEIDMLECFANDPSVLKEKPT